MGGCVGTFYFDATESRLTLLDINQSTGPKWFVNFDKTYSRGGRLNSQRG